jgi:hypothetical protein
MRYRTVHEDLIRTIPELRLPYERLVADWLEFDNRPPGQYVVFSGTIEPLVEVAVNLEPGTPGRDQVLRRAFDFAEAMLASADPQLAGLAIDAVAEPLARQPGGVEAVGTLGGSRLQRWVARHGAAHTRPGGPAEELIDLWGVRAELARLLPDTPLQAIPGISHPADHLRIEVLDDARAAPDGTILLSTFGTTRLYVVARAEDIALDADRLHRAARDLAEFMGGEDPFGEPAMRMRRIPLGERVWNMDDGENRHGRLRAEPWIAAPLEHLREEILDHLAGRTERLELDHGHDEDERS